MPDEPSTIEPVPVQLTRIEGTINLIAYQLGDLAKKVDRHEVDITALKLAQASDAGASSSWKAWLPTVFAGIGVLAALGFGIRFGG